jgi:hypothetical protein
MGTFLTDIYTKDVSHALSLLPLRAVPGGRFTDR